MFLVLEKAYSTLHIRLIEKFSSRLDIIKHYEDYNAQDMQNLLVVKADSLEDFINKSK